MENKKNSISAEDLKKIFNNIVVFTSPVLVVFFGAMAAGTNWKVSASIAAVALYQVLADFFKKYTAGTK